MRPNTCMEPLSSLVSTTPVSLIERVRPVSPAEGILALHDQKLRDLYDLKVDYVRLVNPNTY